MIRWLERIFAPRVLGGPDTPGRWLDQLADELEATRGTSDPMPVCEGYTFANFIHHAPRAGFSWQAVRDLIRTTAEQYREARDVLGDDFPATKEEADLRMGFTGLPTPGQRPSHRAHGLGSAWTYHANLTNIVTLLRNAARE